MVPPHMKQRFERHSAWSQLLFLADQRSSTLNPSRYLSKIVKCACTHPRLPMGMKYIKHKSHARAQPALLQARSAARIIPNDLSITRATHYLRLGP
jgi:hypothetical protein